MRMLLQNFTDERFELITIFTAMLAGVRDSLGRTPEDLRQAVIGGTPQRSDVLLQRAHDRGEIDLSRVSKDVRDLPFQLIRHDILMTQEPLPPERIRSIVDDIFWPLVAASVSG